MFSLTTLSRGDCLAFRECGSCAALHFLLFPSSLNETKIYVRVDGLAVFSGWLPTDWFSAQAEASWANLRI